MLAAVAAPAVAATVPASPSDGIPAGCIKVAGNLICNGEASTPGNGDTGGDNGNTGNTGAGNGSADEPAATSPAEPTCMWDNTVTKLWSNETLPGYRPPMSVPCSDQLGGATSPVSTGYWWSGGSCPQGYVRVAPEQKDPPTGESASVGAWYECWPFCPITDTLVVGEGVPPGCFEFDFWSDVPPPGQPYTPAQAAAKLIASITLRPVQIGMAPASKVHADDPAGTAAYRRTWVGVPVWLWVQDPTHGAQFGTVDVSAREGGLWVSATATADNVEWSSGDGQTVHCDVGTVFDPAAWAGKPATDSPTCGFRFQHTSADQPGGVYDVTATTVWTITWRAGGQSGTVVKGSVSSTAAVQVGQLESVNVPLTEDDLAWAMSH
jgi:hypothetical protein